MPRWTLSAKCLMLKSAQMPPELVVPTYVSSWIDCLSRGTGSSHGRSSATMPPQRNLFSGEIPFS